jgi:23S rRNA (adenine2503-C2)-methyltransferase
MNYALPNIRDLSKEELTTWFAEKGEKPYRAKQVWEWLWKYSAHSFEAMTNLSKELRTLLTENFSVRAIRVNTTQVSNDGTIKTAFKLYDSNIIEGVLIPVLPEEPSGKGRTEPRMTACVSSQVGCSLTCRFCATGKLDRLRNLNADEIFDQVSLIRAQSQEHYGVPLSNVVFMGMGEPLLNYQNVLQSIERIHAQDGLNMSYQRITVSTAGIAKMIRKLGDDRVKFNLALSLHAANDEKRNQIMPSNEHNNLETLGEALKYYHEMTGSKVTYEYIVFKDFNDELADARELAAFAKHVPCKINLIEYNPIDGETFLNTGEDKLIAFKDYLYNCGMQVNIRRSRGKDIDAACGQLATKSLVSNSETELPS